MIRKKIELPFSDKEYREIKSGYRAAFLVSLGFLIFCLIIAYRIYTFSSILFIFLGVFFLPIFGSFPIIFTLTRFFKSKDLKERIKIETTLIVSSKKGDIKNDEYKILFYDNDIECHFVEEKVYKEIRKKDKILVSYSKYGKCIFDMKYKEYQLK